MVAVMTPPIVETAAAADAAAVFDILTRAFSDDPMTCWTWPDPTVLRATFPSFARAFGGAAFDHGSAHVVGGAGAALWLPPGVHPDEAELGRIVGTTMPKALMADGWRVSEQMARHHPSEPHWYLPLIGVVPAQRGKGLGGALLDPALAACDRDGVPAYLESTNPRNITLYERHGFERLAVIQSGSSPTIVPMLRKPRRRT
jgi:ribosomal protein S18 acetylase RimI-like enzyme